MFMTSHFYTATPYQLSGYFTFKPAFQFIKEHVEFFGLGVVLFGFYLSSFHQSIATEQVLNAPQKNDFFYVDYFGLNSESDPRHRYVPLKVLAVSKEEIRFKVGNIAHATPVSPREHAKFDKAVLNHNYYRQKELVLSHETIDELVNNGTIYAARRPKNIYIDGWIVLTLKELQESTSR